MRQGFVGSALCLVSAGLLAAADGSTGQAFSVDKKVTPIHRELKPLEDGRPRIVAAIADESGGQHEFVEDELLVATDEADFLKALLARWEGKVLATFPGKGKNGPARHLVRIDPARAETGDLERSARKLKSPEARYRVSSERGLKLLAAAASEKASAKDEKPGDHPGGTNVHVDVHWVSYRDTISPESLDRLSWLGPALEIDCGYLLSREIELMQQVVNGGAQGAYAEQQLREAIPDDRCIPPPATFDLVDGLVLPYVDAGDSVEFVLQPPPGVPQGFTADIVAAQGGFTSEAPLGGTLYNGVLYLQTDGQQLALYTPVTFDIPDCARTETFTIRLTHGSTSTDFTVTLPVRLSVPGIGIRTYQYGPGQPVDITHCAAGDRAPIQWEWEQHSGDAFPPPGVSLTTDASGNARITGTTNTSSFVAHGALKATQGSSVAGAGIQFAVGLGWGPVLGTGCGHHRLVPDTFFQCELPRPIGYTTSTWSLASGPLPAGLSLVQRGSTWFVEGTVPLWSSACIVCDPVESMGLYPLEFELRVPTFNGVVATREGSIDVGVPFDLWTQNTNLRPSALPLVPNTGDDNAERAQMVLDRINQGTFDVVALQEVFDEEQRDQIGAGHSNDYVHLWGPDEGDFDEESGLVLLVKGSGNSILRRNDLEAATSREVFEDCEGSDCWSNKGFSSTFVPVGSGAVRVVNTHMQAAYDFADQHSGTRQAQLQRILDHLGPPSAYPVVLLGDLNVVGGGPEYDARFQDLLSGWEDPVADWSGDPAEPFTSDKTLNAYSHFWDDHLFEHVVEDFAQAYGSVACAAAFTPGFGIPPAACFPPITHVFEQQRLDHILIRQGTEYELQVDAVHLEDAARETALCRDSFRPQYADAGHGNLACAVSDHYGLSATLRLVRRP